MADLKSAIQASVLMLVKIIYNIRAKVIFKY